ncbi:hypothetical protein B0J11DRAFT_510135 [Dendryphion nanum]|uniref:Heterokaryon incompatibility domain-containing protein n=1 Tax=Dendryphion nanum TaxID=256645 RepID=A0A9P9DE72_9PLEO|nr:hypothetical protein B0J11DRAFT_510135 [Dendryphion nanum]
MVGTSRIRFISLHAERFGLLDYFTKERFPLLVRIWDKVDMEDPQTLEFDAICRRAAPRFTLEFLETMVEWHKRPWFQRVWVVQEFSLATKATFVCGHERISAEQALLARQIFDHCHKDILRNVDDKNKAAFWAALYTLQNDDPSHPFFATRQQRKKFVAGIKPGTTISQLLRLLHVGNTMAATEPCDFIWGVLGLAVDAEQLGIKPNYAMKNRPDLVFTRTAKAVLEQDGLDLIALSQFPKPVKNLPSWVPDWTATIIPSFASPLDESTDQFTASGTSILELVKPVNDEILGLKGFHIDQIEKLGSEWHIPTYDFKNHVYNDQWLAMLIEVDDYCKESSFKNQGIYSSKERRAEAKWRVPIGDIEYTEARISVRARSSYEECYVDCKLELGFTDYDGPNEEELRARQRALRESGVGDKGWRYRQSMRGVVNKRPFLSSLGYVGMGPRNMQLGDHIVVFKGANIPYIVRRLEDGNYMFVGECYCDGIMDGGVIEERQEQEFFLV